MLNFVKIFLPASFSFFLGIFITPLATHFFYKYKMWKKHSRNESTNPEFQKIHNEKEELKTPRVGGIIIWVSVVLTTLVFFIFHYFFIQVFQLKLIF